jgi:hypothetical protein
VVEYQVAAIPSTRTREEPSQQPMGRNRGEGRRQCRHSGIAVVAPLSFERSREPSYESNARSVALHNAGGS